MATATQSSTAMLRPAKSYPVGVIQKLVSFNIGGTVTASGATVVKMCKVPVGATILGIDYQSSSGAATTPVDVGIDSGNASTFASAGAAGSWLRATKGFPYRVPISDDATVRYRYVTMTATPSTQTVSLQLDINVSYTLDE